MDSWALSRMPEEAGLSSRALLDSPDAVAASSMEHHCVMIYLSGLLAATLAFGSDAGSGTRFRYNSHGSHLIACMVQRAVGLTLGDYLMRACLRRFCCAPWRRAAGLSA